MCLWWGLSALYRLLAFVIAPTINMRHCLSVTGYSFFAWDLALLLLYPMEIYQVPRYRPPEDRPGQHAHHHQVLTPSPRPLAYGCLGLHGLACDAAAGVAGLAVVARAGTPHESGPIPSPFHPLLPRGGSRSDKA